MSRRSALLPLLATLACLAILAVPASAAAPTVTGLPAISGTARVGQTLTATTGTFTGTAPIAYTRAWLRCDASGAGCAPIAGAGAATYTLAGADVGATIRVTVTATNLEGAASATSPATPTVAPLAPPVGDPAAPPAISGTLRDGQVLSSTTGTWSGTMPMTFARSWRRCDAAGGTCGPIASTATLTLTSADVGATIRVQVTATNADGQGVATSAQTAVVDPAAPVNTVLPVVTGTARSGQTLTSTGTGTWTGTTPLTYGRQWQRCDAGGGACAVIGGAVGSTYVLTDADVGATIRLTVTATNVAGSATVSSVATATVGPRMPPVNTTAPSISGTPTDGLVLTAADGGWSGTATIATTRRWQRCAPLGVDCVDLAVTATTLTLTSADVGATIRLRVTSTNPDGTAQATSATTAVVAPAAPSATTVPAISGTAKEGQLLTATTGTWKGTPTISYGYAWERCAAGGCSAIAGATSATYRVDAADVGRTLRVAVTATNAGGTATATSPATATVTGGVPVSVDAPSVSAALPRDGETASAVIGTWAGSGPIVTDRQWLRCAANGGSCSALSGEVGATYRLSAADVGKTIRVEITATNAYGAVKAQSAPSPVILAAPPQPSASPTISGTLRDGQTIAAASSWTGTAPIALTHQWQRCEALVDACVDIAGATADAYRLTSAEVGARMRVRIGALNAGGGGTASSDLALAGDPAGLVAAQAPQASGAPSLSGSAVEGSTLTSGDGTFGGTQPLTRTTRWQRCDAAGGGCIDIAGATGSQRVLTAADRGATVRAVVTATNVAGSDSIASAPSAVVALAPPRNLVAPAVAPDTGLRDGATLIATDGGWAGSEPMTLTYRWQRCTSATDCTLVAGAAATTYMLTAADVGFALRIVVSAANGAGTVSQASAPTGVVGTNPPVNVLPPTVAGTARDGDVLTAVDGVWIGPVVVETTYEWWRCDLAGANCAIVPGATAQSLVLRPADIGLTLRARIVRSSDGGVTGAFSDPTAPVVPSAPANLAPPQIIGAAAAGRTLTADPGAWSGTPPLAHAYQWRRCEIDGSGCVDVAGADGLTYAATAADEDASLRVVVTTTNAVGSATATSASTAEVQTEPPSSLVAPRVLDPAGPVAAGTVLTADPGTWAGAQPLEFAYRWSRCDAALASCATIAGATAGSYLLAGADVGKRIVVTVTASNLVDDASAASDGTTAVLPAPPSSAAPPVVTAAAGLRDGAKLVASFGTWNGATPMTYAVSWLRCAADGGGCGRVPGADGTTYTLGPADVGQRIRARVAATNVTAETSADSAATAVVQAAPPASTAAPSVEALADKPEVGTRLRAQTGAWSGTAPFALALRWQRCPATSLAGCEDVPGATASEYALIEADVGRRLRVVVTASNAAGSASASATPTVLVPPVAPASATAPRIRGTARVGRLLRAGAGTWRGTAPLTFAHQWQRCKSASDRACASIDGATGPTYKLVAADAGKVLRVAVTASNAAGKATRASAATRRVARAGGSTPKTTAKRKRPTSTATTGKKPTTTTGDDAPSGSGAAATRMARIAGMRLSGGRLLVTLRCPRAAAAACRASGTIVGGTSLGESIADTSLRFRIATVAIARGAARTRGFALSAAQRRELSALRDVNFRVRLAVPGTSARDEVFVRTRVPASLRA